MASPWSRREVVIDWVEDVLGAADKSKLRQLAEWQSEGVINILSMLDVEGADETGERSQQLLVVFEDLKVRSNEGLDITGI